MIHHHKNYDEVKLDLRYAVYMYTQSFIWLITSMQYYNWRTDNVTLPKFYGAQMVRRKNFRYKKPRGYMTEYTLLIICNIIPQLDNTSWWFRITDHLNNKRKSAINSSRLLPLGPERPMAMWQGGFDTIRARALKVQNKGWRWTLRKLDICGI